MADENKPKTRVEEIKDIFQELSTAFPLEVLQNQGLLYRDAKIEYEMRRIRGVNPDIRHKYDGADKERVLKWVVAELEGGSDGSVSNIISKKINKGK